MQIYYLMLYFFTYGFLGWCTEVAFATVKQRKFVNRGFLNGPICPVYGVGVSIVVFFLMPYRDNRILLYILSTILVTLLEGLTGWLMDKIFHHKWWDYTGQPLNIGGYVCLVFSLIWGAACVVIMRGIHPVIHKMLSLIPQAVGIVIIAILELALFVDLYVTAAGILKLNRQLDAMAKIAAELRELSDKLGEDIYENVMDTLEVTEESRRRLEDAAEESKRRLEDAAEESKRRLEEHREESKRRLEEHREESKRRLEEHREESKRRIEGVAEESRRRLEEHREELREKYEELSQQRTRVSARLMKAFPKMESRHHKDVFDELREKFKNRRM